MINITGAATTRQNNENTRSNTRLAIVSLIEIVIVQMHSVVAQVLQKSNYLWRDAHVR
jgi:hypothetical protein